MTIIDSPITSPLHSSVLSPALKSMDDAVTDVQSTPVMSPINILLVEDNEGDVLLTTEALEDGGICNQLDVVRDGWEAIQYLDKSGKYIDRQSPDLILLDINLPKMNGYEVLEHAKKSEALRQIPVIILTTSSSDRDIKRAYQSYANCYITKPVSVDQFHEIIRSIENFWLTVVHLPIGDHPTQPVT